MRNGAPTMWHPEGLLPESLLDSMPDAVCIVNPQHDVVYANGAMRAELGDPGGQKCYRYFHGRREPCPWCTQGEVLAGKAITWERYVPRSGKTYSVTAVPIRDRNGAISRLVLSREISDRAGGAMAEDRDVLLAIMENTDTMLAYLDSAFNFVKVNSAYASGCGHDARELVGKNHFALFPNEETRAIFEAVRDTGQAARFRDKPFQFKDQPSPGVTYWDWALRPVKDASGSVCHLVLSLAETTERRKTEQLKDEFIGLVSHELRTPMTVITGGLNTVLEEFDRLSTAEVKGLLSDAASEAESLNHMLGNLLDLARAKAKRLTVCTEPVRVDTLGRNVVRRVKRLSAKPHRFLVRLSPDLPKAVADPLRLERVLHNILENAAKYSPPGSEIVLFGKRQEDRLLIGVRDHGPGLSEEDQARLFEPFERLNEAERGGVRGAGLGLLTCKRLLEAQNGRIWVESTPGEGATFMFTLPVAEANL